MERHGASHRITAKRSQDPTAHHQPTPTSNMYAPSGTPNIPIHFGGGEWRSNATGLALSADEVEQVGLDPSLRQM